MTSQEHIGYDRTPRIRVRLGHRYFDALTVQHVVRRFAPHFYDRFSIGVVESGECQVTTPRGTWLARPGSLLTFSPGELHSAELVSGSNYLYRMLYLTPSALEQLELHHPSTPAAPPPFRSPVVEMPGVARAIRAAHRSIMEGSQDVSRIEDRLLHEVHRVVRHHARVDPYKAGHKESPIAVNRAAALLSIPTSSPPSMTAVAGECNMSAFHLMRVFRRYVGASPYAYYLSHRVNRARQMLHEGVSVSQVAYTCGFSDQSHLTRMFKRAIGLPPGFYLKAVQRIE